MNKLKIELENCYGIKKLQNTFDFSASKAYAIYAPNGSMKTSLAQTFKDIADSKPSKDRIFPDRECKRTITDENDLDLPGENVFVIRPYDDEFNSHTEKTSTLLVDNKLRKEYEDLHIEIDESKDIFLKAMQKQSGMRTGLEEEISSAITQSEDEFFVALERIKKEITTQKTAPFANIDYKIIFNDKVLNFLKTKDFKTAIESYIKKYNELLDASTYFKKGTFNYYNAATIAKNLAENGFFNAKHTVNLNAEEKLEITSQEQLVELITKEKEGISSNKDLRKKYDEIEKMITKNVNLKSFWAYITSHEEILPSLSNVGKFKEDVWKSYIKEHFELYNNLIDKYQAAEKRKNIIEEEASKQSTQWEEVIEIFNSRFFVPFTLTAKNRIPVILGTESMLSLGFTFEDGGDQAPVEKNDLMQVLSTGEKRALYVLNIIFEVEARKKANQETLFIIDDIADSFDYKNKYAIIQYLKEIAEEPTFRQIILTHNFDFFRTLESRFIQYNNCLMATKNDTEIILNRARGIKNIFVKDWKVRFFQDPKKKIASIPFIRNLVEYTKGEEDADYLKLTSLLHWKANSIDVTQDDLDAIYNTVFCTADNSTGDGTTPVIDIIETEAKTCLSAGDGINFENKIILSIAIRLAAERFMVKKIDDDTFWASIDSNQTTRLLEKYKDIFGDGDAALNTLNQVILMTPENIHLNSFMYEPILDMSDDHLKLLYSNISRLS